MSGAIAAYYLDVDNQHTTGLVELSDGSTATVIQNIGRTAVIGVESEFSVSLSERISARATYAYTDAEIRERISVDEADLRGSNGSPEQLGLLGDVSGKQVPRVPEHTASVMLRYERPLDWGSWYFSGDYTYESSSFAQEHNLIETGNQNLVGLRTGLTSGAWEVSLWVANLFDDDTPLDIQRYFDRRSGTLPSFPQEGEDRPSSSPRGFGVSLARGRQLGATLRYRF